MCDGLSRARQDLPIHASPFFRFGGLPSILLLSFSGVYAIDMSSILFLSFSDVYAIDNVIHCATASER